MIDVDAGAFLEGGCALLIGTVDNEGMPHANRCFGLDVLDPAAGRVRVVLPGDDPVMLANLQENGRLAITGTDVSTLRSIQAKGRVQSLEEGTAADGRRAARYCDAFFSEVEHTDATPRPLLERLLPPAYRACVAVLDEWYDQTPGPKAGCRVDSRAP